MEEVILEVLNYMSLNADTIILTFATSIVAVIMFVIKYIFKRLDALVAKTETELDDKVVSKVREVLREKVQKL